MHPHPSRNKPVSAKTVVMLFIAVVVGVFVGRQFDNRLGFVLGGVFAAIVFSLRERIN